VRAELYTTEFIEKSVNPLVRKTRTYRGRKNLSARLSATGRGKSLLLNGHMDTVPTGNVPWSRSPWSGAYRDGCIHSLGSFDMKGRVAASAAVICAMKKAGIKTGGDILFESVVDEEWGAVADDCGTSPGWCLFSRDKVKQQSHADPSCTEKFCVEIQVEPDERAYQNFAERKQVLAII